MDRLGDNSVVVCYLATVSPGLVNLEKNKKPIIVSCPQAYSSCTKLDQLRTAIKKFFLHEMSSFMKHLMHGCHVPCCHSQYH